MCVSVENLDLEHSVVGVDKRLVDAKFSIVHELLSVQTVAADKSEQAKIHKTHPLVFTFIRENMERQWLNLLRKLTSPDTVYVIRYVLFRILHGFIARQI